MATTAGDKEPSIRFVVSDGTERCEVRFSANDVGGNNVKIEMSGGQALSDLVQHTLVPLKDEHLSGATVADNVQAAAAAARTKLQGKGLTIQDLPAGDIEFRLEVDMNTGRAVGQSKKLHELANEPPEMAQKIHGLVVDAFQKVTAQVGTDVKTLVAAGDHEGAAKAVAEGWATISIGMVEDSLLDALLEIDDSKLSAPTREDLRKYRVALGVRLERYDSVGADAAKLLKENSNLGLDVRIAMENVTAIAASKAGHTETALSIWRRMLKTPENINTGERAWILQNMSKTLAPTDPEAVKTARLSVDAFLQDGDKNAALGTLRHLSELLERHGLQAALEQYESMLDLVDVSSVMGKELAAAVHHAKANRLREAGAHKEALAAALNAVELRRGLTGVDEQLVSSLHLASMEAVKGGDATLGAQLDAQAKAIEERIANPQFNIGRRVAELFKNFQRDAADALLAEARANGDPDVTAGVAVAIAVTDPELDSTDRLRKLESTLTELRAANARSKSEEPVLLAIAKVLETDNQHARAATFWRKALDVNPLSLSSRDGLINALWRSEDWGSAAMFLSELIQRHGEAPGLLYAYGRSLLEAGDASKAVTALQKCMKLADTDGKADLKEAAQRLRDKALDLGGTILPDDKLLQLAGPVLREEVEQALEDFGQFIAADKRMRFWQLQDDGTHKWTPKPEQKAQDLLHTFVRARFASRVAVFEEVDTGAGRLDVLLRFEGGLTVIIELKMCGGSYPSSSVHLGYLVVLDGRLEKYGAALLQGGTTGASTIVEVFVDVRPRVSERKKPAAKQ
jgi:tetratricopeptide (TPR) repeat protein